jgi:hypothetical protein
VEKVGPDIGELGNWSHLNEAVLIEGHRVLVMTKMKGNAIQLEYAEIETKTSPTIIPGNKSEVVPSLSSPSMFVPVFSAGTALFPISGSSPFSTTHRLLETVQKKGCFVTFTRNTKCSLMKSCPLSVCSRLIKH